MAFSDRNNNTGKVYDYDFDTATRGAKTDTVYRRHRRSQRALTYTSYLTNDLSMKLLYGENDRENFNRALSDLECNACCARHPVPLSRRAARLQRATRRSFREARDDKRKAARADFEWKLARSPAALRPRPRGQTLPTTAATIRARRASATTSIPTSPAHTLPNGGVVPGTATTPTCARAVTKSCGNFQTIERRLLHRGQLVDHADLPAQCRPAPRRFRQQGWRGPLATSRPTTCSRRASASPGTCTATARAKLFGNLGRYFLPVANVINIKQGGALLDQRTYYAFDGWQIQQRNGSSYAVPILGPQIGAVDNSQGDGTRRRPALRSRPQHRSGVTRTRRFSAFSRCSTTGGRGASAAPIASCTTRSTTWRSPPRRNAAATAMSAGSWPTRASRSRSGATPTAPASTMATSRSTRRSRAGRSTTATATISASAAGSKPKRTLSGRSSSRSIAPGTTSGR